MPKNTKDTNKKEVKNTTKKTTKKTTTKKSTSTKSTITKTTNKAVQKSTSKKVAKIETKKTTNTKSSTTKKNTIKKSTTKESTSNTKTLSSNIVAEYYDLPYRYNETVVKILYQTPSRLFVYWDISDNDRDNFIKKYGENFFNETKPVLKIFNLTKGYNFEVEINDFANSWYIDVSDSGCDYKVELSRKKFDEYIPITVSNNLEFPNDHILINELPDEIRFKNVKNNNITIKNITSLKLIGINKIYNINDFYKKLYKDDIFEEIKNKKLLNPSSSSWN